MPSIDWKNKENPMMTHGTLAIPQVDKSSLPLLGMPLLVATAIIASLFLARLAAAGEPPANTGMPGTGSRQDLAIWTQSDPVPGIHGKKETMAIGASLPEITSSIIETPSTRFIGPIRDVQNSSPSIGYNMTSTIPLLTLMGTMPSLLEHHTLNLLKLYDGNSRLVDGESHRMNLTTAAALQRRDCVNNCP